MSPVKQVYQDKKLFQLLILFAPTQLAFHYWPASSLVFGIRVDYLAITVFFTDIIIALLVAKWLLVKKENIKLKSFWWCIPLLLLAATNTAFSLNPLTTTYKWLKVFEFSLLAFWVSQNWEVIKDTIRTPLSISLMLALCLSLAQLVFQQTIGGPFYLVGERTFNSQTPGIAMMNIFGREYMRPYATFPHPNVLGGFALASLPLLSPVMGGLAILIVLLSFSQSAWLGLGFIAVFYLVLKVPTARRVAKVFILLAALFSLFLAVVSHKTLLNMKALPEVVQKRLELSEVAGEVFSLRPLEGVGLGNFIYILPSFQRGASWWLQPVHNSYLLVLAEVGISGMILFYFLLSKVTDKCQDERILLAFLAISFTGLFDHYWLTLQQTQILFAIVIGAALAQKMSFSKNARNN